MAREITIYGQTYELTDGVENYAKVRKEFEELAEKYEKQYKKDMKTQGFNVETLMRNVYEVAENYFDKATDVILKKLTENGVYTVSRQDIESLAAKYGVWQAFDKEFDAIAKIYYQIIERAEEAKLQREMRKESRGRIMGGGFGLKGAAKGMIQASLLNGVTGLGHSVFNAFGNARTEREKKEQLYTLHTVAEVLLEGAFKTTISNYYLLQIILFDEFDISHFEWPTDQSEEQAKAILENLSAGRVPKDRLNDVLFRLITLDPFSANIYNYILERYGDSKGELEVFGEAHGLNLRAMKAGIIENLFRSDIDKACETFEVGKDPVPFEKELTSIQNKLTKKKKNLGLTTGTECESIIKKEMKNLGAKYKTVDGVEFKTIEEAKAARKDLKLFYECISLHGIGSKSIREEIMKLDFKTDIVTANLEKRLEEMSELTDSKKLGKRIESIFKNNGLAGVLTRSGSMFAEKLYVIGVSEDFDESAEDIRELAEIPEKEKIILMFINEPKYEYDFWWVLTNDNLYTFENADDTAANKKVVPFHDIEFVRPDNKGNLVTRIKGGVDRTDYLGLESECSRDTVRESFKKILEEILYLITPLSTKSSDSKTKNRKKDIAQLDVKKLAKNEYWKSAVESYDKVKEHACVNENSPEYKELLNQAKQYWECTFEDETVYFVFVDSSIGSSIVLTSERCYIYGTVHSTKQKYVFPVDKISTFRGEDKGKKYLMFFDVDYFKANYFNCSGGGVCFNTVDFNMFNIPENTGRYLCRMLTSLGKEIRKPMLEKGEKREQFEKAIAEATDIAKTKAVIQSLNNDKVLEEEERNAFLAKAQQKLDKYQNAAANAKEQEQMVATVNREDLTEINRALNKLLKNDLFDESDKKAITELIEMQLEIGSKLYATELNNFFHKDSKAAHLLYGKPVYMKKNSKETAGKLCDFLIRISFELEEDEIPLVYFKNGSQFRSMPPSPPDAEECMISNKRLLISFSRNNNESYALNDVKINQMTLEHSNRISVNGKLVSFCFPYVKIDEIEDRVYRSGLRSSLGGSEHAIVAKELSTFVEAVYKTTVEKVEMEHVLSKLPIDGEALKTMSREALEREYTAWGQYTKYGAKVTNYLALVETAIKEIYKKEAGELCVGLSEMSASELKAVKLKLQNRFALKNFAACIAEETKAVDAEITKRVDMETRETVAAKSAKLASFTRAELESEYKTWSAYKGTVTEAKEFLQSVKDALEKVYKEEVAKECANLGKLTVQGAKDLLTRIDRTYLLKDCIMEEIASVEAAIVAKQEEEIKGWMPEELELLSVEELEGLISKYHKGNYEPALYDKYALPVIERRNARLIDTAYQLVDFIHSKASYEVAGCLTLESKEKIAREIKNQQEAGADALLCTIGKGDEACKVFIRKLESDRRKLLWENLCSFEAKKKLFGGVLNYWCKASSACEMNIRVSGSLLTPIANLLNEMISFMSRTRTAPLSPIQKVEDSVQNVVTSSEKVPVNPMNLVNTVKSEEVRQREPEPAFNEPKTEPKELSEEYKAGTLSRDEEYKILRPLVEPLIPVLDAHITRVKEEYLNYKVLVWDGDPAVIQGEKAPILVAMHDVNCSPQLFGTNAIKNEARFVLGILPDYVYIVNTEKFILYVKGQKNEWKISTLRELGFKNGFLSSSLLVTDVTGMQKKITIDSSFQKHVDGLNKIFAFVRDMK